MRNGEWTDTAATCLRALLSFSLVLALLACASGGSKDAELLNAATAPKPPADDTVASIDSLEGVPPSTDLSANVGEEIELKAGGDPVRTPETVAATPAVPAPPAVDAAIVTPAESRSPAPIHDPQEVEIDKNSPDGKAAMATAGTPAEPVAPAGVSAEANEAVPGDAPMVSAPPKRRQLCARPEEEDANMVRDVQEVMEETTCTAALWLDGLFGDQRNIESARRTSGYLETSANYSEFEGNDEKVRFRVRFKLPNLKNRATAVFGRDNEDDVVRDRTEGFAVRSQIPQVDDDESWLAGLGYSLPGNEKIKSDFRVGTSGLAHPRVYVQQRLRYIVYSDDKDLLYSRATAFWTNQQGFGTTVGFDYSRVLGQRFLLRLSEVGTISEKTEGLDWFSGVILYQNLGNERAMAYELLIRGQTDEPEPLYEYGGRVVYRHPVVPKRLYAEFLAGYSWPRTDPALDREGSAQVGISLEVPFGQRDEEDR